MTYRITGLDAAPFKPLFEMSDEQLAQRNARRVTVTKKPGFPCRISLQDADPGEQVVLLHHVSHDVDTPYRSAYAIYVRGGLAQSEPFIDRLPPVFEGRPLAFRGFDAEGMLRGALLAMPGEADDKIRELFEQPEIDTIHAHNAAYGCFAAKIERN
jgi:hypothetical protein